MKFFTYISRLFEHLVFALEWLINYLDPNKHRLKGVFMPERKVLSSRHKGFNINGRKNLSPQLSMQGVLINGETGSFKTAGVVLRSILTVNGSQIIHDPSGELYQKSSGTLAEKGYRVLRLDFNNPKHSLCFNPMLRVTSKSQITKLATDLVMIQGDETGSDHSFWNQKAIEVLYVLISILKIQEKQFQTLYQVAHLLDLMQSKEHSHLVDKLFAKYADNELFTKFASICSQSENTLSSILSTAQASIQLFSLDENIASITSADSIGDFQSIRLEKTALYIHSSTAKMRYYSKITSIFLSQYFENFFDTLPHPEMETVYFHLDELPLLSIGSLDIICANIRKYRGAIMGVTQNAEAQLTARYGKRAEAIISNLRTKIYLSADLHTASKLERSLGRYEYQDKQDGDKLKSRAVLTADEIMSLPQNRALVLVSGMRAIKTRITPYFKIPSLRKLSELPPYEEDGVPNFVTEPVLLPLEEMFPNATTVDEREV